MSSYRWRTDESNDEIPYSHHGYAYALSNPVLLLDPAGTCAVVDDEDCHQPSRSFDPRTPIVCAKGTSWWGPSLPFQCVPDAPYTNLPDGPLAGFAASLDEPIDIGFVVGAGVSGGYGAGVVGGIENVYDLYDFEADTFIAGGFGGYVMGGSVSGYIGGITGWSGYARGGIDNYKGPFGTYGASVTPISIQGTFGPADPHSGSRLRGILLGVSVSSGSLNVKGVQIPLDLSKILPKPLSELCGLGSGTWYWSLDSQEGDIQILPTRQKFHHYGFRKQTMKDAKMFAAFLRLSAPRDLANIMIPIVLHNGAAWERKHHIHES